MYDAQKSECKSLWKQHKSLRRRKSKLYSDQQNRLLTFKNELENHHPPVKTTPLSASVSSTSDEHAEITPPVPASPKPNFLTPPATEKERPKLKRIFFPNWVDSSD